MTNPTDEERAREPEFFDLGNGMAVCADGRWRGWLFRQHPDGQLISLRKLPVVANPYGALGNTITGVAAKE